VSVPNAETVVLVHGLWFGPWSMRLLDRRLRKAGFATRRFSYRSIRAGLDGHAAALRQFAEQAGQPPVHFVAHSLGGLVTLRMLAGLPETRRCKAVLLGTPLSGSVVARKAARIPGAARLLGEVRTALEQGFADLPPGPEVGMIAGNRPLGLGLVVGGTAGAGDGTVALGETRSEGLQDYRVLPVTHTGLLFSARVAGEVSCFLRSGSFSRAA
jgi:pimeloyl-ACP methyl ester carboxylesterase